MQRVALWAVRSENGQKVVFQKKCAKATCVTAEAINVALEERFGAALPRPVRPVHRLATSVLDCTGFEGLESS